MSQALINSPTTNLLIVAEARKWIDVPYRHQGRDRRGIDCAGLIVNVGKALGLLDFDATDYERYPSADRLLKLCEEHGERVQSGEHIVGDVVLMRFKGEPQHLGIIGEYEPSPDNHSLIHAYNVLGKVVEHRLDKKWENRIVAVFTYRNMQW